MVVPVEVEGLLVFKSLLDWFVKAVRRHFSIGNEDVNDSMSTGQRVAWVFDEKTKRKKYIGVTQKLKC